MAENLIMNNETPVRDEKDIAIQISGVKKRYKLGLITAGTLKGDIVSWWARKRGKEDPTLKIGAKYHGKNETFMALDGIDLTIYKGERIGIIGHNGAGKSTLLKLLARVTGPTEGEIKIDGRITSMLEVGTGFNGELTGRENIYLNGAILGMTKAEVDKKMEQIIEFSECRQFIDTPVKRYSSGMFVKLAFSVAAHLDSEIMIMDEVLAVGDMAFQKKCLEKMSDVSKDEGRTILYVSHNMNTIRQLCDRVIVLKSGEIIYDGGVEDGIDIYMQNVYNENMKLPLFYDCGKLDRVHEKFGKYARILEFEYKDVQQPVYEEGAKIRFRLKWEASTDMLGIKVRASIKKTDGVNVGMAELGLYTDARKGVVYNQTYDFDASRLTEGTYFIKLFLYQKNMLNVINDIDGIPVNVYFKIIPNIEKYTIWSSNYWGATRFNDLELLETSEDYGTDS